MGPRCGCGCWGPRAWTVTPSRRGVSGGSSPRWPPPGAARCRPTRSSTWPGASAHRRTRPRRCGPSSAGCVRCSPRWAARCRPSGVATGSRFVRARSTPGGSRTCSTLRGRVAVLSEALALWTGNAYADADDHPAVAPAAARLAERHRRAVEDVALAHLDAGAPDRAAEVIAPLLVTDPLRERARAIELRGLVALGRAGEALTRYQEHRRLLAEELGMRPVPDAAAAPARHPRSAPEVSPAAGVAARPTRVVIRRARPRARRADRSAAPGACRDRRSVPAGSARPAWPCTPVTRCAMATRTGCGGAISPRPDRVRSGPSSRHGSGSPNAPARRCPTGWQRSSATGERCWCWTTANTSSPRSPRWSTPCWLRATGSTCWPPAVDRSASTASTGCGSPRWRRRQRDLACGAAVPGSRTRRCPRLRAGHRRPPSSCAAASAGCRWPSNWQAPA